MNLWSFMHGLLRTNLKVSAAQITVARLAVSKKGGHHFQNRLQWNKGASSKQPTVCSSIMLWEAVSAGECAFHRAVTGQQALSWKTLASYLLTYLHHLPV